MTRLYHFTSSRGLEGIRQDGHIRANLHNVLGEHIVWLTTDPHAKARDLGIARRRRGRFTDIDRMAHCIEVDTDLAVPWSQVRTRYSPGLLEMLEAVPGVLPDTWWVSFEPLCVSA